MPERNSQSKPKALLVEDEFVAALHAQELLHRCGFEVVGPARRVDEAIRFLEEQSDLRFAVLDVDLAGETVWPVARLLIERSVPFLLVTGDVQVQSKLPSDLKESKFLLKPLDENELLQIANSILLRNH